MMADRRRRSPEGSNRRRKESRRSEHDEPAGMRYGAQPTYSSSSSSSEYVDISHSFPPKLSSILTFFTAPSERRRLRKRRSSRLLKLNNASSSSINSDLAYGTGYVRRQKRKVRSRKGKEIDRERHSERERERYSDRESERPGPERRATTDAEILAVGAGLAKLAREQNKLDLRSAKSLKRGEVIAVTEASNRRDNGTSRGLGPSKTSHGGDSFDEDGWESASDAESESSVDSRLAFGEQSQSGWSFWGRKRYTPLSRKSSVVDPRLFGRANSLHGIVTEPVGFAEVSWKSSSDFGQHDSVILGPDESVASGSQLPLQHVYPYPTNDPSRFEAARGSVISGSEPYVSSRPRPIPIQQPQPITPVSQSIYEPIYPARSESGTLKRAPASSGRKSLAEAALAGVAVAAIGAAITSDRTVDRKVRSRNDGRDDREEDRVVKRREGERRDARDDRKRDKRDSPGREERKEKYREKERQKDSADDQRRERKREKRRDEPRDEGRDEQREKRREERRSERSDDRYDDRRSERTGNHNETRRTKSEVAVSTVSVDPFQYQVGNDAFDTPNNEPAPALHRADSIPTVVTVEREPSFTRKRTSSIKDQAVSSKSESRTEDGNWDDRERRRRGGDSRDRALHDAEAIYQETEHSTAPIDHAAIGAAVAAVTAEKYRESRSDRRRDERRRGRRDDYDDNNYNSQEKETTKESKRERDPIQEEADRAYREIVMARKIASQVIRSRTPSPDRSVVDKYDKSEEEVVRIVTPPGMEDHKKQGPYDAPNADFRLDHVLEDPRDMLNFRIPSINLDPSNPETSYLQKDPDAIQPRPLLNLVRPTPTPSPLPEKQLTRTEPARPSKPKVETSSASKSDVVIEPKGNGVSSPTTPTASKGVTWGENETKHYEIESSSEHRDEVVSSPEIQARDNPVEQSESSGTNKRSGWGAIAAGILGGGVGAAVANSSQIPKSSKIKENQKKQDAPSEYSGTVVEPESPPGSQRQRSPPSTGPKPSSAQTSHIPGAFDDDLEFTATVAAGLQRSGFDPNIVIDDPKFRRRDSPPGSNEPGFYRAPYAETVSDLGSVLRNSPSTGDPAQGFVAGEAQTATKDWAIFSLDDENTTSELTKKDKNKRDKAAKRQIGEVTPLDETSKSRDIVEEPDQYFETKLSKKEQKKRDKAAQRQNSKAEDLTPFDEPSVTQEIVEEPESYFDETPEKQKKSKKSKKVTSNNDAEAEDAWRDSRKVSVPADAFDDLRNEEDEWNEPKKSKKKSKRDSERYDSPSRSAKSEIASELERSSSKKSKDKSRRKSEQYEPENDPIEISLPPSTPSENSRNGDLDDSRKTRKIWDRDDADRDDLRSVVSADAARYDDEESRKSKKKSRSSTRDDLDDTRSVASAPADADFEDPKKAKKKEKKTSGSLFGLFGSKSESVPKEESSKSGNVDNEEVKKKSKKSKRTSMPDVSVVDEDYGSQSVGELTRTTSNGNGNGLYHYDDDQDDGSRSEHDKKTSPSMDKSASSKKESFLANAGTLGAGVGLAGAAVAIAAQLHQQSKADNAYTSNKTTDQIRSRGSSLSRQTDEVLDTGITQRQFRPSIDPQYGDLLPLPPSDPASPNVEPHNDLPELPESRPDTPEGERISRDKTVATVRKSTQEISMKSPSQSAVPLKFFMGSRSTPSSPGLVRAYPLQSPVTPNHETLTFPRIRSRPTSWDSTKEYKPLYLVESNRRGSSVQEREPEEILPALPPSQRTSRSSSELAFDDDKKIDDIDQVPQDIQEHFSTPLSINTVLASSELLPELPDSQQSTPKVRIFPSQYTEELANSHNKFEFTQDSYLPSLPAKLSLPPEREDYPSRFPESSTEAIVGAALVSSIGYFASSSTHRTTDQSWLDQLPLVSKLQHQPSAVDSMTKDRSSYLLQSSPLSRKNEEYESVDGAPDSPSRYHGSRYPDRDALRSIQERDGNDIFEQSRDLQPAIEQEREKTLDTLSGSSHDLPDTQEVIPDIGHIDDVEITPPEPVLESTVSGAQDEIEPAGDFAFTKPKKGKKKGRVLSRSSTEDMTTLPETSPKALRQVEVVPAEEIFFPKSKKDKSKKKGASRFSTQDEFFLPETSHEISQEPSVLADVDPTDEFSLPKSKKDKKKDKKRGNLLIASEREEDSVQQTPEEGFDVSEGAPRENLAQDDFFASETKKGKKINNKKGKSAVTKWKDDNVASNSVVVEEPIEDIFQNTLEEAPATDHLVLTKTKQGEVEEKSATALVLLAEEKRSELVEGILPETDRAISQETSTLVELSTPKLKKGKTKKAKSVSTLELEKEQEALPPVPQESETMDEFVEAGSKKSKKGKKSRFGTADETFALESMQEPAEPPISETHHLREPATDERSTGDDFEQFVVRGSKESKTRSRKSESLNPDLKSPQVLIEDEKLEPDVERSAELDHVEAIPKVELSDKNFQTSSNKGKKKSRKPQSWHEERQDKMFTENFEDKSRDPENATPTPDGVTSRSTPMGGPGAWPITPLDPSTSPREEVSYSSATGYFPYSAVPHSPFAHDSFDDSQNGRFPPSATALLPIAAAGAVAVVGYLQKDTSASGPLEAAPSGSFDTNEPGSLQTENNSTHPIPDGLKAGYNNNQLSLARRLQEEFATGSRKSKKDNKSRQSLPTTPDPEISRSRDPSEASGTHPRARSLSIGPSADAARLHNRPASEERTNVYSQEQLELARQLKAEFDAGNKKSKKDKKKRPDPSRSSTQDEPIIDQLTEEPQSMESEAVGNIPPLDTIDKDRDGFLAGYQEDQLSVARQLQAEFVSVSKKSKKDKKRRSTSQTPTQDQEPQIDYFGHVSPPAEAVQTDGSINMPGQSSIDKEADRDGLAVGYTEGQLDLARQLREEFDSGSKKSKKDKKDKKRQNLLRTTTDEEFSSGYASKDVKDPLDVDSTILEPAEAGDSERAPPEPEDALGFVTTKSKKSKKSKKRESLVSPTNDGETPSETITRGLDEPRNVDVLARDTIGEPTELPPGDPENVFVLERKNLKKEKKGKKREILLHGTTEDDVSTEDFGDAVEALHNARGLESENFEAGYGEVPVSVPTKDILGISMKKSKKDKKKRQSLAIQDDSFERPATEADRAQSSSEEPSTADAKAATSATEAVDEPIVDFGLASKKSKKDKKRQSLLRSSTFDDTPELQAGEIALPQDPASKDPANETAAPFPPLVDEQDDGFDFTSKKSKKGKKLRHSIQQPFLSEERSKGVEESIARTDVGTEVQDVVTETGSPNLDTIDRESALDGKSLEQPPLEIARDDPETVFGNVAFITKVSKKDKKKRKGSSVANSEGQSGLSTQLNTIQDPAAAVTEASMPTEIVLGEAAIVEQILSRGEEDDSTPDKGVAKEGLDDLEDEWGLPIKNSKERKKKRKSGLSKSPEEILDENAVTAPEKSAHVEKLRQKQVEDPEVGWASFTAKKKGISGLSTPLEETSAQPEAISHQDLADFEAPHSQPPSMERNLSITHIDNAPGEHKEAVRTSAPVEGAFVSTEAGQSSQKHPTEIEEPTAQLLSTEPEIQESTEIKQTPVNEQEVSDDAFGFIIKPKKNKKKRTSGSPTPLEDRLPTVEPNSTQKEKSDEARIPPQSVEGDLSDIQTGKNATQSQGPGSTDDGFEFAAKKSKKDKRAGKASQVDLGTDPSISSTPSASALLMDIGAEDEKPLSSEATFKSPIPLDEKGLPTEERIPEPSLTLADRSADPVGIQVPEMEAVPSRLGRKESKKDRRKRQAMAADASMNDAPGIIKAPLPSWADDAEQAEVERESPVMEDIAKDESLSHIISTPEAVPVDYFSQQRYVAEHDKEGNSGLTEEAPKAELFPVQFCEDSTTYRPDLHSYVPVLAASAVLGSAALLYGGSVEHIHRARSSSGSSMGQPLAEQGDTVLPPRKLETPAEQEESRYEVETMRKHSVTPPRNLVETPSIAKNILNEQSPSIRQRRITTAPEGFVETTQIDKDFSIQEDPVEHRSSSRYSIGGSSWLPVVREESPAQVDSEVFANLPHVHVTDDVNRDSAFITESPIPRQPGFVHDEHIRDSGVHLRDYSPSEKPRTPISSSDDAIARLSWPVVDEGTETVDLHVSPRSTVEKVRHEDKDARGTAYVHRSPESESGQATEFHRLRRLNEGNQVKYHDDSLPSRDLLPSQRSTEEKSADHQRTPTIHRSPNPSEDSIAKQPAYSPALYRPQKPAELKYAELNPSQKPKAEKFRSFSDNSIATGAAVAGATMEFAVARQASREQRPGSAQSQRSSSNINRQRTPDAKIIRPESVDSNRSRGTPPLRRSDRKSADLRSLSQRSKPDLAKEAELSAITTTSTASISANAANPTANEGRARAKEMADVYDGFGEGRMGSPRSPTRPHSMRRRQSMQVLDLESRVEQLAAENRMLADAKAQAERNLQTTQHASSALVERDSQIDSLKRTVEWLQNEVARLTEVSDGLSSANVTLGKQHHDKYNMLETQHAQATRELQEVRDSHNNLSAGMEGILRNEVQSAVQDKDQEIAQLRAELEAAKEQIRQMQRQILTSAANDHEFLTIRDEDYFDNVCQQLCQRVQQWVIRFSKFSDMRACRLTSEINNDKIIDRLDNAILDGSDVDSYLADRIKRRDVFMSMTMTMVWEFVFTRYLFGMDREQRQKLKSLERLLSEAGPASAVHQWRATTLTLLSKREPFVQQREQDTLAVVNAILETLTEILPPPSHLEDQIQEQLLRVIKAAVDLSIEMRTQRAEYMMLPPLQPEYDANGDLASKVSFNAALMNERSGESVSNEELEAQKAVVRVVLFPLVVKKGDDSGEGDEEIVVCPAQVLVARSKKQVRVFSPGSQQNHSRVSMQSSMPADYGDRVI